MESTEVIKPLVENINGLYKEKFGKELPEEMQSIITETEATTVGTYRMAAECTVFNAVGGSKVKITVKNFPDFNGIAIGFNVPLPIISWGTVYTDNKDDLKLLTRKFTIGFGLLYLNIIFFDANGNSLGSFQGGFIGGAAGGGAGNGRFDASTEG